jgi:hypothetical protein
MRAVAVADESRHVAHRQRLPREQLDRGRHPPRHEILAKREVPELRVRALELARRARERSRDGLHGERAAIVARDEHPREQIDPATFAEGAGAHIPYTDARGASGTPLWSTPRDGTFRARLQP